MGHGEVAPSHQELLVTPYPNVPTVKGRGIISVLRRNGNVKTKLPFIAITSILAIATIAVIVTVPTGANDDTPGRLPWVGEDGIVDESLYPDTIGVVDSTGQVVGTVETRLLDADDFEQVPVKDSNGVIVGYFGTKGYWAMGESEPDRTGTVTIKEYADPESDQPTSIRVVND